MAFYPQYYYDGNDEDTDEEELGALIYKSSATAKAMSEAKAERESMTSNVLGVSQNAHTHCVADSIVYGETKLSHQLQHQEDQKNLQNMEDASHVATPKQINLVRPINNKVKSPSENIWSNDQNAFSSSEPFGFDDRYLKTKQQQTSILLNQVERKHVAISDDAELMLCTKESGMRNRTAGRNDQQRTLTKGIKPSQATRKTFSDWIADLKSYKAKHGHLNVSLEDHKKLAKFCLIMRWSRRNPGKAGLKLDRVHIASLDALGFNWGPKKMTPSSTTSVGKKLGKARGTNKKFSDWIADLKAYKEKHGHLVVSRKEDKKLAQFCDDVRARHRNPRKQGYKLDEDRIESLNAIGFNWDPEKEKKKFSDWIADLKAYKEKHGHLVVSKKEDKKLAQFCVDIRTRRRNPRRLGYKLDEDRIESLNAIGFVWDPEKKKNAPSGKRLEDMDRHLDASQNEDIINTKLCNNAQKPWRNPGKIGAHKSNGEHTASMNAVPRVHCNNFGDVVTQSSTNPSWGGPGYARTSQFYHSRFTASITTCKY